MKMTDVRIDWVLFKADTKEVMGCRENSDGSMTEIRTVGTYDDEMVDGLVHARLGISIVERTSGKNLADLGDEIVKILQRDYDNLHTCSECEGTGLFSQASWDSPQISCDECNGTGVVGMENPNDKEHDAYFHPGGEE
jgi:predicted methyltransferase